MITQKHALAVFNDTKIRKVWHQDEWWFSVIDVTEALTESVDSATYWRVLKHRMQEEGGQPVTNCNGFKLPAKDGKLRETDCANTEGIFRIIQSIPSPKAEPFKLWLAKTGYERVQEIEDPERAQTRMQELYRQKGYSEAWIEKRVRGIAVRDELTHEWKNRKVGAEQEYAILTAEISKATFGMTPKEYEEHKNLSKQNLRDHMNDLELIFTMLGEASTTKIARAKDAQFEKHRQAIERIKASPNGREKLVTLYTISNLKGYESALN